MRRATTRQAGTESEDCRAVTEKIGLSGLFMGRTYLFECSGCGYRAHVAGGADRGRQIAIQTISCDNCRELYDAVVEFKASRQKGNHPKTAPKFTALLNRLPSQGARKWVEFKLACPVSPLHHVHVWKQMDKCPRCGMYLGSDGMPFRLWD